MGCVLVRLRIFKKLRQKLNYLDAEKIDLIHQAYVLANSAHQDQKRNSGEPYITHPVEVACILADIKLDYQTIMAALLHDVIEDTDVTAEDLVLQFGQVVTDLVQGVTKLTQIEFVSKEQAQAENFRKMVLAMAEDIRVILVKLADRLHNMRTLNSMPQIKKSRISRETLDIYAPVAKRLGMREFSVELEELSFISLYPWRYKTLKDSVEKARGHRKKVLHLIEKTLREGIEKSRLGACMILGREKHLYSLYRKMRAKKLSFDEVMDVYAMRIIVEDVDNCYRTLGVVHGLFKPVPERFKDYISIPKANGYQSLHTTLFGPYGLPLEIQIRTTEMDRMATSGIAAHWLYKSEGVDINESQLRAQRWVKNLLELQKSSGDSLEFIESVKLDLFPDEVYVFTPKGAIKELPAGATAVDFAYAVHTDLGNSCVAVKVDRQLLPLSTVLCNGQTIEVITSSRGQPNLNWLDFVVTSKARSAIRHYMKTQRYDDSQAFGQQLLGSSLRTYQSSLKNLPQELIADVLKEFNMHAMDDLYIDIGLGNRSPVLVAQQIARMQGQEKSEQQKTQQETPMLIHGTEGLLVDFSRCCCPIPGDSIVGVLHRGHGIIIHMSKCIKIKKLLLYPEQCVPLNWADDVVGEFMVPIELEVENRRGILATLALAVSDQRGNVEDISVTDRGGRYYQVRFVLLVKSRLHLADIIRALRQLPEVQKIVRA